MPIWNCSGCGRDFERPNEYTLLGYRHCLACDWKMFAEVGAGAEFPPRDDKQSGVIDRSKRAASNSFLILNAQELLQAATRLAVSLSHESVRLGPEDNQALQELIRVINKIGGAG